MILGIECTVKFRLQRAILVQLSRVDTEAKCALAYDPRRRLSSRVQKYVNIFAHKD